MRFLIFLGILLVLNACKKDFVDLPTQVLGHAGESLLKSRSKFPPNTLESVQNAFELGAKGVEIDVQMTSDSVLVAYHDPELSENSNGEGCINSLDYNELVSLEIYKSDEKIDPLKELLEFTIGQGKELFLDVKHANQCTNEKINYSTFNKALNEILVDYSEAEKNLVTVNCRDYQLLQSITDTVLQLSFEYDDVEVALPIILGNGFDKFTVKLENLDENKANLIKNAGVSFGIFNIKTRSEIYQALEFAPDFVISDNISCTLNALNE